MSSLFVLLMSRSNTSSLVAVNQALASLLSANSINQANYYLCFFVLSFPFFCLPVCLPAILSVAQKGLHPTSPSNPISTPVERRLQNFRFQSQFAKKMSETDAGGQQPPQQQAKLTEYTQQFVWNKPLVEAPPVRVEPLTSQYQRDFKQWPLHAVQQANGRAADTVDAVSVVSATSNTSKGSKGRASVAQSFEPRLAPAVKQSEYHAKFKPFTEYVYVEGDGFRAEAAADQQQPRAADLVDGKTKEWYREVEERSRQACKYRARSQMGVEPHGEHAWDGAKVADHDLQALALATRLLIEEKRAERQSAGPKGRSASAKPFNRKCKHISLVWWA